MCADAQQHHSFNKLAMLTIDQGHVFSGEYGIRIFRPKRSALYRPKAECVLALHREARIDVMLIRGDAQFDDLVVCLSIFAERLLAWTSEGKANADHFELGHARVAVAAAEGAAGQMYVLALQIFDTPANRLEPSENPVEDIAAEWKVTMTLVDMLSLLPLFAKVNGIQLVPALLAGTEQWCSPAALAAIGATSAWTRTAMGVRALDV